MSKQNSKLKIFYQNSNPFWLLTIAIASGLILPLLFMDGMFFDGLILSTVSRNFTFNFQGFWNLTGGQEFLNPFYDQPPLMFWLNGLFYKLVGDTIYTERMYSLLMAIIQMLLVNSIWKAIFYNNKRFVSYGWLPVLFWAVIPVNNFVIINNMEEATMPVFILASVLFMLRYILLQSRAINLIIAGLFIFLAVLTKGIQCSFPLVFIPCYWLSKKKYNYETIKWMLSKSSIVFIVFSIPFALLLLYPPSKGFITNYFEIRLVKSFADSAGEATTDSHFYLLARILMELIPVIVLLFIGTVVYYLQKLPKSFTNNYSTIAMSLFLLGLSGFLPFMATLEQRGWYLYPSLLVFMLALSIVLLPYVDTLFSQLKQNHLLGIKRVAISLLVVVLGVTLFLSGKPKRDADILSDIKIIQQVVPEKGRISIQNTAIQTDLESIIYFERYAKIALIRNNADEAYYLTLKDEPLPVATGYKKHTLTTQHYDLYSK